MKFAVDSSDPKIRVKYIKQKNCAPLSEVTVYGMPNLAIHVFRNV